MAISKNPMVKCDYCNAILKAKKYSLHVKRKHNHILPNDFDLLKKINDDLEIVNARSEKQFNKFNPQEAERRKWHKKLLDQLQKEGLKLKEDRERDLNRNIKNIIVIWDDIVFGKDCIKFDTKRINTIIQPLQFKGIIESLNLIKEEYFKRLFSIKYLNYRCIAEKLLQNFLKVDCKNYSRL
jgi:hypothetical protein